MSWDNNPYYKPESFGLKIVAAMDWDDEAWQFNMTVAWMDEEGNLYWAHDAGCSCPSPFEDYTTIDSLRTGTTHQLFAELDEQLAEYEQWTGNYVDVAAPRVAQFKEEVLRKWR